MPMSCRVNGAIFWRWGGGGGGATIVRDIEYFRFMEAWGIYIYNIYIYIYIYTCKYIE